MESYAFQVYSNYCTYEEFVPFDCWAVAHGVDVSQLV